MIDILRTKYNRLSLLACLALVPVVRSRDIRELLDGMPRSTGMAATADWLRQRIAPNLIFKEPVSRLSFLEKRIGDLRMFFLRNESDEDRLLEIGVPGPGSPEEWDAWTGKITPFSSFRKTDGGLRLFLQLAPMETRVIVLNAQAIHPPEPVKNNGSLTTIPIEGPWLFSAGPIERTVASLFDWSTDPELKGFSGTASYSTVFQVRAEDLVGKREVWIRLGEVADVAVPSLNGTDLPALLFAPYAAVVTELLQPGSNQLGVRITNSETNAALARGADLGGRFDDPVNRTPMRAGLLGPVELGIRETEP